MEKKDASGRLTVRKYREIVRRKEDAELLGGGFPKMKIIAMLD
jgi:hypothetical protein